MGIKDLHISPAGLVPTEWKVELLAKHAVVEYGIGDPLDRSLQDGIKMIGLPNVGKDGRWTDGDLAFISKQKVKPKDYLQQGDILFNWRNGSKDHLGKTLLFNLPGEYTHVGFLLRIRCKKSILPDYLNLYLKQIKIRGFFLKAKAQVNNTFNKSELEELSVVVPPINEQRKIAQILKAWDLAIDSTEKLIKIKQQLKETLMENLLTAKKRFPEFLSSSWRKIEIGNCLKIIKRPIAWDDEQIYNLLSVRRRSEGIFLREKLTGNQIKTKNMNMARSGDFIISKMQIVHGAGALVTDEFDGMHISNSYISLVSSNSKVLDIEYFSWLAKTSYLYHLAYISSYGVHIEKMTFNVDDYFSQAIFLPQDLSEQRKIVSTLNMCDKEIEQLKLKLSLLEKQKRGLMQKLLTGQTRVKVEHA